MLCCAAAGPRGEDRRQGGRVQLIVPPDPAHQARQPSLQARDAGARDVTVVVTSRRYVSK